MRTKRDEPRPLPGDPGPRPFTLREHARLVYRTVHTSLETRRERRRGVGLLGLARSIFPAVRDPVFLLGSPRSGTTFLGACFEGLPSFSYHFEPVATKAATRAVWSGAWSERGSAAYFRRVYRWLLRLHCEGGRRFVEKTPRIVFIGDFLARTFPNAKFVHIVRDGRDVAVSWAEKPWLRRDSAGSGRYEAGGYPCGPYPHFWVEPDRVRAFCETTDAHRCAWGWRRHVEAGLDLESALGPGRVLRVRYESLAKDPEEESRRIAAFLGGLTPEDLDGLLNATRRVRSGSIGRWRTLLSELDTALVTGECGNLLKSLGYDD